MSPPGSRTSSCRIDRESVPGSGNRPSRIRSSSKRLLETIRPFLSKAYVSPVSPNRPSADDAGEFLLGPNPQRQRADHLKALVADRRGDEHRGHAGPRAAGVVLHRHDAGKRRRQTDFAVQSARKKRLVFRNVLLADQLAAAGGDDPLLLVGDEVAGVVVGRQRRARAPSPASSAALRSAAAMLRRPPPAAPAAGRQSGECRGRWPATRRSTSAR